VKIKPKYNWTSVFNALECAEYNKTGRRIDSGVNCFSMIVNYLDLTGHDVSYENELINGYTYENIVDRWQENDQAAVEMARELLKNSVIKIEIGEMKIGDILVARDRTGKMFPCVYTGNGKVFTMTAKGSGRIKLALYEIVEVYRGSNL